MLAERVGFVEVLEIASLSLAHRVYGGCFVRMAFCSFYYI